MTMTRPTEWKGSDLRSRTEVVRYLRQHGGEVTDQTGLVVGAMRAALDKGRALSQLLSDMEADGMIEREVRGRRTFRITLKDDWNLAPAVAAVPEPEPAPTLGGTDPEAVAEALLAITLRRATTPPPAPVVKADPETADRLMHAVAERDEARRQLAEAEDQVRILTHNVSVLQAQLDRKPQRDGPTIAERLSEEELATLAQLQRELPSTPATKQRR